MKLRLAGLALAAGSAGACPIEGPAMRSGEVQAAWAVAGTPIAVGRHFALEVQVCPDGATLARVDAVMPEHRHGMNYRPSLKLLGAGRWRAEGLMFHMPGRWELRLDVDHAGQRVRLAQPVVLP